MSMQDAQAYSYCPDDIMCVCVCLLSYFHGSRPGIDLHGLLMILVVTHKYNDCLANGCVMAACFSRQIYAEQVQLQCTAANSQLSFSQVNILFLQINN